MMRFVALALAALLITTAVIGRDKDDWSLAPSNYDEIHPSCYDPKARLAIIGSAASQAYLAPADLPAWGAPLLDILASQHRPSMKSEAVEARAFVLLLILATVVVAPLWLLGAPLILKIAYTVLAYALPAALMFTNPGLGASSERTA